MTGTLLVRDREFYRKIIHIGIPVLLQNLITIAINMMDTIMLGSLSGAQISASSLANRVTRFYQIICMGIGFGSAVMTSQYWGRKDIDSMKRVITIMLRCTIVFGVIITTFVAVSPSFVMSIFTPDKEIIEYGAQYFRFLLPTFIMMGISFSATLILRSTGSVRIPLISSIVSFFLNVFFNWVFIFGKLGAPRMEIGGAAVGTLIARGFEFCFIGGHFLFRDKNIKYRIKDIFISSKGFWKEYIKFALPVLTSDSLIGLANIMHSIIIGHISSVFVAANAIAMVVFHLAFAVGQGTSSAACVIIGNTIGEGNMKKVRDYGRTILIIGIGLSLLAAVILLAFAPFMGNFYNIDQVTKKTVRDLMFAMAVMVPWQMYGMLLTKGVLRGGGDTRFLLWADIVFMWVVSIPLTWLTGIKLGWTPFLVYCVMRVDQAIKTVVCLIRYRTDKWIKKVK